MGRTYRKNRIKFRYPEQGGEREVMKTENANEDCVNIDLDRDI